MSDWIPCSKVLPPYNEEDKDMSYLVTIIDGDERYISVKWYKGGRAWCDENLDYWLNKEVIAWRPIEIEPYRGE